MGTCKGPVAGQQGKIHCVERPQSKSNGKPQRDLGRLGKTEGWEALCDLHYKKFTLTAE